MLFMGHFFKLIMTVEVSNCVSVSSLNDKWVFSSELPILFFFHSSNLFSIKYEGFTVAKLHVRIFTMSDQLHVSFAFTHGEWGPIPVSELHIL
jgi:hypothetical protein